MIMWRNSEEKWSEKPKIKLRTWEFFVHQWQVNTPSLMVTLKGIWKVLIPWWSHRNLCQKKCESKIEEIAIIMFGGRSADLSARTFFARFFTKVGPHIIIIGNIVKGTSHSYVNCFWINIWYEINIVMFVNSEVVYFEKNPQSSKTNWIRSLQANSHLQL